jgi:thiol-disulfide isomerase/thioredoxin
VTALLMLAAVATASAAIPASDSLAGPWRAALELEGGRLPFSIVVDASGPLPSGRLCNAASCETFSAITSRGDSVTFEMADFAAVIRATWAGDSLVGSYSNVGNRGPRIIPFHAARGSWPEAAADEALEGSWDAEFVSGTRTSPRVLVFQDGAHGMEGTIFSSTGDYGVFSGHGTADSFALAHFDGSYVYLVTGALEGDTLRGVFHAGLRTRTPFTAVRSTGGQHLRDLTSLTRADTSAPFTFSFPDPSGTVVSSTDARFRDKVLVVDIFGTWCPTCHNAAPVLVDLWQDYHERGLEIVGLAYEVSGDPAVDGPLVRRYREKFGIPFPLLLAGVNVVEETAATLPQLEGFTSYPTTLFIGRDGTVRKVYAGFYGPVAGPIHERQVREFRSIIEQLLEE